jgi:hypothetical protein
MKGNREARSQKPEARIRLSSFWLLASGFPIYNVDFVPNRSIIRKKWR